LHDGAATPTGAPDVTPTTVVTPTDTGITRHDAEQIIPLPPAHVTARPAEGAMVVSWTGTGQNLREYEVYRHVGPNDPWHRMGKVAAVGDNTGPYQYTDKTITPGTTYIYGVIAVH